jgi:hypothetical protein
MVALLLGAGACANRGIASSATALGTARLPPALLPTPLQPASRRHHRRPAQRRRRSLVGLRLEGLDVCPRRWIPRALSTRLPGSPEARQERRAVKTVVTCGLSFGPQLCTFPAARPVRKTRTTQCPQTKHQRWPGTERPLTSFSRCSLTLAPAVAREWPSMRESAA